MKFTNYLNEMPWISYGDNTFDLEIEKTGKNHLDFINLLKDILTGKKLKDKYGSIIHLKSDKDKENFINALKNDNILKNFLKYTHNDIKRDFNNIIKK
jgi:hypothetical protein